jgi:ABC-type phosphate transport system permease subunit
MGVVIGARADAFRPRDGLVTSWAYTAGTLSAAAFVALTTALVFLGWRDFRWALSAPGGPSSALLTSLLVVAAALPVTCAVGMFAAACATDTTIGGRTSWLLSRSLEWSAGIPPVVIGVVVFFVAIALTHAIGVEVSAATLVVLNLSNSTARFARAFSEVSDDERAAAAAAGASPVVTFFSILLPRSAWALGAAFFRLGAQMSGETAAIVAANAAAGRQPLSAQIWHFASNASLARTEAAACMLLVLVISAFTALSRVCASKLAELTRVTT